MLYTENRSYGNHTCSVSCQRKHRRSHTCNCTVGHTERIQKWYACTENMFRGTDNACVCARVCVCVCVCVCINNRNSENEK